MWKYVTDLFGTTSYSVIILVKQCWYLEHSIISVRHPRRITWANLCPDNFMCRFIYLFFLRAGIIKHQCHVLTIISQIRRITRDTWILCTDFPAEPKHLSSQVLTPCHETAGSLGQRALRTFFFLLTHYLSLCSCTDHTSFLVPGRTSPNLFSCANSSHAPGQMLQLF